MINEKSGVARWARGHMLLKDPKEGSRVPELNQEQDQADNLITIVYQQTSGPRPNHFETYQYNLIMTTD